ncbi:MAG: SRPBCC family protein [Bacteroidota bacterium]
MHQIKRTQIIPVSPEQCWNFFMDPDSLAKITPERMKIQINSLKPEKIYEGLLIAYRVRPLLGIPLNWVTEITTVKEQVLFVDIQSKGPLRFWHHEHHFREVKGGVEMTDILSYALPFAFLGKIVNQLLVKRQMEKLFDHRQAAVEKIFGKA